MAAPFGSAEYLQKNFGEEGKDFTFDSKGNPVYTKGGETNAPGLVSALLIMSSPENPVYSAQFSEDTQLIYDTEKKLLPLASRNPTAGTYSDTSSKVGAKLTQLVRDKAVDILTGRAKVSDLDAVVARWKSEGGNKMREEFQKALPPDVSVS
jgi:putative aldouronate transport system substrate-binding protein